MKLILSISIFLLTGLSIASAEGIPVDTLKKLLTTSSDSLKGSIYSSIAAEYMHYDTISSKEKKLSFQSEAIANTLKAIHFYSKFDDTTGLRTSFNTLATVYLAERKFSQAKWFILQSNTLSRVKNDTANVISSLLVLATVKIDIKDYTLAMQDLNEALALAGKNAKTQARVQLGYVMLYNNMQNYTKADIALKRYNAINDSIINSINHSQQVKLIAAADSAQRKKKLFMTGNKRLLTANSTKKTTLL